MRFLRMWEFVAFTVDRGVTIEIASECPTFSVGIRDGLCPSISRMTALDGMGACNCGRFRFARLRRCDPLSVRIGFSSALGLPLDRDALRGT